MIPVVTLPFYLISLGVSSLPIHSAPVASLLFLLFLQLLSSTLIMRSLTYTFSLQSPQYLTHSHISRLRLGNSDALTLTLPSESSPTLLFFCYIFFLSKLSLCCHLLPPPFHPLLFSLLCSVCFPVSLFFCSVPFSSLAVASLLLLLPFLCYLSSVTVSPLLCLFLSRCCYRFCATLSQLPFPFKSVILIPSLVLAFFPPSLFFPLLPPVSV